jgi:molybdate/tungstate transport system substrate-binding protein
MTEKRLVWTFMTLVVALALAAGCVQTTPTTVPTTAPTEALEPVAELERSGLEGNLIIFHAGSLTVPVDELAKVFQQRHPGVKFQSEASGSDDDARKISELGREADLMMSADYTVIDKLLIPDFADWNVRFARNTMVVSYPLQSEHADEFSSENWYEIVACDGVIFGRSEPDADPCGYRTLLVWQLAEEHYNEPGLYERLDENCPPGNLRPKSVELIALLESGDMDYVFEYKSVSRQPHNLSFKALPPEVNLSDPT